MEQEHGSAPDGQETSRLLDGERLDELVLYEIVEPHIARITLNRPHRRNALLVPEMQDLLEEKVKLAEADDSVKVMIVAASGDHFCSGDDLRRLPVEGAGLRAGQKLPQSVRITASTHVHRTLDRLLMFSSKTSVLACRGAVVGAGFNLAMTADMVIASETAWFARPQARLGFSAFSTILPVFMTKFGPNRAVEILMTGRTLSARMLADLGIVNSLVADEALDDEALRYARAVALHSTDGLMISRKALQMYWNEVGMGSWASFMSVAHPLFTNLVWRDDEYNFLRERSRVGHKDAMSALNERWAQLGFE